MRFQLLKSKMNEEDAGCYPSKVYLGERKTEVANGKTFMTSTFIRGFVWRHEKAQNIKGREKPLAIYIYTSRGRWIHSGWAGNFSKPKKEN